MQAFARSTRDRTHHNEGMIQALLLALVLSPVTVERSPTDDVWVYPHSSDTKDVYLRVWGAGGKAVAGPNDSIEDFAYSYLRFDLGDLPKGALKEAKLVLTATADAGWSRNDLKNTPLEARLAGTGFNEKDWAYDAHAIKFAPSGEKDAVFGTAVAGEIVEGKETTLTIDLLAGPAKFAEALEKARADRALALALTTALDPSEVGRTAIYRLYSKDAQAAFRPILRLTFEE